MSAGSHPFVELARQAIETYVREGRVIDPPVPVPGEFMERAGVFVCIKKNKVLRGCIGTLRPEQGNLALEIIRNAICTAVEDPRFPGVAEPELGELEITVDVLSPSTPIKDTSELDPKRYGVVVKSGYRRALLLPDLEGVDTVKKQLEIAKRKAGISPGDLVEIERFEVRRYT